MCGRCKKQANGLVGPVEELCEEVETVKSFCYLGDRVNANGKCSHVFLHCALYQAAVTQTLTTVCYLTRSVNYD